MSKGTPYVVKCIFFSPFCIRKKVTDEKYFKVFFLYLLHIYTVFCTRPLMYIVIFCMLCLLAQKLSYLSMCMKRKKQLKVKKNVKKKYNRFFDTKEEKEMFRHSRVLFVRFLSLLRENKNVYCYKRNNKGSNNVRFSF